jgi:hypothetical protein
MANCSRAVKRGGVWLGALLLLAAPAGCKPRGGQAIEAVRRDHAKEQGMNGSDVATLAKFVNLPYPPLAVQWETANHPGGRDWSLAALIAMKPEEVNALVKSSPPLRGPARVQAEHLARWFPAGLRDRPHADGGLVEVDAVVAEATSFIAPDKSPLVHGDVLLFPKEGLAYLRLYTM